MKSGGPANMSLTSTLDAGIRAATRAVNADLERDFERAAQYYRRASALLRTAAHSKSCPVGARKSLEEKCAQYDVRLRKLERHLLSKADLSNLFRVVVADELRRQQHEQEQDESEQKSRWRGSAKSLLSSGSSSIGGGSYDQDTDSVNSAELGENPFLAKGLEAIQKAKLKDSACQFEEALQHYEKGIGILLDALRCGRATNRQADSVRIKCLLLHDRCELIRDHLECGAPIRVRKPSLGFLENSLEGSPSSQLSSPMLMAEDETLMEEMAHDFESRATSAIGGISFGGSTHSLYPMCVEVKRCESTVSGQSDFAMLTSPSPPSEPQPSLSPMHSPIPLADLGKELQLSLLSIDSRGSNSLPSSTGMFPEHSMISVTCPLLESSNRSEAAMKKGVSSATSLVDMKCDEVQLQTRHSVSHSHLSQLDVNVTELTFANSCHFGPDETSPPKCQGDSDSDSGFSDPLSSSSTPVQEEDTLSDRGTLLMKPAGSPPRVEGRRAERQKFGVAGGSSVRIEPQVNMHRGGGGYSKSWAKKVIRTLKAVTPLTEWCRQSLFSLLC